jgi:branched-chain amino acid transport system permease protein
MIAEPTIEPAPRKVRSVRNILLGRTAFAAVLIAALLALNSWIEGPKFNSYNESILVYCGIYIVLAVALNIVNGFTGQFSLGHIGFYMIGSYVAAALGTYGHDTFFRNLPIERQPVGVAQAAWPMLCMGLCGGLSAALVGFFVGLPSLRLRGDYLAIITLGFAQIIQIVIRNIDAVDGNTSFTGIERHGTMVGIPALTNFFWVYLLVAVTIWVAAGLRFSSHGLAFLAVREDELAAEAMGINTTRYKVIAFVVSAFFTGVAGALFALYQPSLSNDQFSFMRSIDTVVMVVLGGLGSISGVAIAAVLLTVLPYWLLAIEQYRLVVFSLMLIILMLTRPQGIFGREELSREWLKGQWAGIIRILRWRPGKTHAKQPG